MTKNNVESDIKGCKGLFTLSVSVDASVDVRIDLGKNTLISIAPKSEAKYNSNF